MNHTLKDELKKAGGRDVTLLLTIGQKVEGLLLKVTRGENITGWVAHVQEDKQDVRRLIIVDLDHVIAASWPVNQ